MFVLAAPEQLVAYHRTAGAAKCQSEFMPLPRRR